MHVNVYAMIWEWDRRIMLVDGTLKRVYTMYLLFCYIENIRTISEKYFSFPTDISAFTKKVLFPRVFGQNNLENDMRY